MKLFTIILISTAVVIVSCTKQNGTPTIPGTGMVDTLTAALRYTGAYINGPYGTVSGQAKIYFGSGAYLLKLEGVNISNGPDLHVYLSKEVQPINYIDLGRLQSVSGNQVYNIPGTPNFSQYRYALIHCQRFNHLFGSAELK